MATFCSECGTEQRDAAKFCSSCGASLERKAAATPPGDMPGNPPGDKPGNPPGDMPGSPPGDMPGNPLFRKLKKLLPSEAVKPAVQTAVRVLQNTSTASGAAGEALLPGGSSASLLGGLSKASAVLSPLKMITSGLKSMAAGFRAALKDKKKLLPAIILALSWLFLTLLPAMGINPLPIKLLSFLTFAQGGMSNNVFRLLGGVIGKTVFASFVFSLLGSGNLIKKIKLFFSEDPVAKVKARFASFRGALKNKTKTKERFKTPATLAGMGCAMVFFAVMVGTASPWSFMAGVAAVFLSLRAAGGGFFYRLVTSLFAKVIKGGLDFFVKTFMRALPLGFSAATALGLISFGAGPRIFGILLLAIAAVWLAVLLFTGKGKAGGAKEAGI